MDDVPPWIRSHAKWISRACMTLLALAIVEQLIEIFTDWVDNEWLGVALGFLSAAAIGLDALVVGVRRIKNEGPSIRNLAPGGWACFAAMLWIVAVPAYFFARRGARRRFAQRGIDVELESISYREAVMMEEQEHAPATWRDVAAIAVIGSIAGLAATGIR